MVSWVLGWPKSKITWVKWMTPVYKILARVQNLAWFKNSKWFENLNWCGSKFKCGRTNLNFSCYS